MENYEKGQAAVREHARLADNLRDDEAGQVTSLLADLRHASHHWGLSFAGMLATSRMHYEAESGRAPSALELIQGEGGAS